MKVGLIINSKICSTIPYVQQLNKMNRKKRFKPQNLKIYESTNDKWSINRMTIKPFGKFYERFLPNKLDFGFICVWISRIPFQYLDRFHISVVPLVKLLTDRQYSPSSLSFISSFFSKTRELASLVVVLELGLHLLDSANKRKHSGIYTMFLD